MTTIAREREGEETLRGGREGWPVSHGGRSPGMYHLLVLEHHGGRGGRLVPHRRLHHRCTLRGSSSIMTAAQASSTRRTDGQEATGRRKRRRGTASRTHTTPCPHPRRWWVVGGGWSYLPVSRLVDAEEQHHLTITINTHRRRRSAQAKHHTTGLSGGRQLAGWLAGGTAGGDRWVSESTSYPFFYT